VCLAALDEVEAFVAARPDVPVYLVDVRTEQPLSQSIAARTGVRHESPQVIILRRGAAAWCASHHDITTDAIQRNLSTA
jgi:bacillithiol system protein YtxJ